jgi:hypothetical protein
MLIPPAELDLGSKLRIVLQIALVSKMALVISALE